MIKDDKTLSLEGYFEDGSEPIQNINWSIGEYVENGDYYTNSNNVEDCFGDKIPSDGIYDFVINEDSWGDVPIEGIMKIENGKIDIPHLSNQIPKDYYEHNRHIFIEGFEFVNGRVKGYCGS
jgi:hypothetical protein